MQKRKWLLEGLAWIGTLIIIALVLLPIVQNTREYPFYLSNAIIVLLFVTLARWLFLWKFHPWARSRIFRYVVFIGCIVVIIEGIGALNDFQRYVDEYGLNAFLDHLSFEKAKRVARYIKNETIFFSIGLIITAIILPVRIIISNWRQKNKNTV